MFKWIKEKTDIIIDEYFSKPLMSGVSSLSYVTSLFKPMVSEPYTQEPEEKFTTIISLPKLNIILVPKELKPTVSTHVLLDDRSRFSTGSRLYGPDKYESESSRALPEAIRQEIPGIAWKSGANTHISPHVKIAEPEDENAKAFLDEHTGVIEVWVVERERLGKGLGDRLPSKIALAVDERDAFDKLLILSGFHEDEIEIANHGLTYDELGGPLPLCQRLKELTLDRFDCCLYEVHKADDPVIAMLMGRALTSSRG
ncbi:hypothetical protein [Methylobacterium indicum]|uniref:hypothetical protein n=1 Tax=Methylobacterium indicum TaxID=1775910 RepID=UPI00243535BC|nr:hypothetical protein [Methylobacterium indicum]